MLENTLTIEKCFLPLNTKITSVRFRNYFEEGDSTLYIGRARIGCDVIFLLEEPEATFCLLEVSVEAATYQFEEIKIGIDDMGPVILDHFKELRKLRDLLMQKHNEEVAEGKMNPNWLNKYIMPRGTIRIVLPLDKPVAYKDFPETAQKLVDMVADIIREAFDDRPACGRKQRPLLDMTYDPSKRK